MENAINMVWELFVEEGHNKKEKEGKKKGEGKKEKKEEKKREREKEKKGREKEGEKESGVSIVRTSDYELKFVYSTRVTLQEVGILPTLVYLYHLSYCFGLLLGPRCAMFMACFVVLIGIWPILRSQLRWGCSQSKGLLPEQIWVESLRVQELPKCSCNPRAHYCMDWCNSVAPIALQLWMTISFSSEL